MITIPVYVILFDTALVAGLVGFAVFAWTRRKPTVQRNHKAILHAVQRFYARLQDIQSSKVYAPDEKIGRACVVLSSLIAQLAVYEQDEDVRHVLLECEQLADEIVGVRETVEEF